jgi:trimeric autotransporter adhesin
MMSSFKNKLRIAGSLAALGSLALAVSCTGFFVNPTLTALSVQPVSPTIQTGTTGNTVQMTAFGTNNDGSSNTHPSVSWSITPTTVATISTSGLVSSVSTGTATVTATSNQVATVSGTQTVTVTVGCITSITLNPTSGSVSGTSTTVAITATAATCNGSSDVTSVATWTSSNNNLATVSAGVVSQVTGITTGGTVTITASIGGITSNVATINVSP